MQLLHVLTQFTLLGVMSVRCKVGETTKNLQLTRVPKQIQMSPAYGSPQQDNKPAETGGFGIGSASLGHGKYFQYQHVPHKDHYEFGHKRGNEHHFTERHEKAAPHHGIFKTKARWGDKHGGYGEHYWDYNHAGHHHDGGGGGGGGGNDSGGGGGGSNDEESSGGDDDEEESDGYSHNVPEYSHTGRSMTLSTASPFLTPSYPSTTSYLPQSSYPSSPSYPSTSPYSSTPSPFMYDEERVKRQHPDQKASSTHLQSPVSLVYDIETGTVINEATGKSYVLHPVN